MLSQAVIAAYDKPVSNGYHRGQLTVTGVSPCPYATYLNYHHLDDQLFDAASRMRMKNGKWQELEILEDLKRAGFELSNTGSDQMTVHVGKSRIAGRPDGLITVDSRKDMLEIKAMSLNMYTNLKQKGVDSFPGYKCQVQLYLASEELRDKVAGCWFYAKHKDSCRPYDIFVERDESYSQPIIDATDRIVLDKAEVSRPSEVTPLCSSCRHKLYCWKSDILDTSGIGTLTKPEIIEMWLEGQFHLGMGKQLNEEARVLLKELLGTNDVLYIEDQSVLLEVKKIIQHRTGISESKFIEKFGAAALTDVIEETIVEQMRVKRRD